MADSAKVVNDAMGRLRLHLGRRLNLIRRIHSRLSGLPISPAGVRRRRKRLRQAPSVHRPLDEDLPLLATDPGSAAKAYDLVLNGSEVGGGSLRIYQRRFSPFSLKSLNRAEEARKNSVPPGGVRIRSSSPWRNRFRFDRLVTILAGASPFGCDRLPKTRRQRIL